MNGGIALAVALSGIAALLLEGGRTAHSRFKIPIALTPQTTCFISAQSALANLIRNTALIVWDEAPMTDKLAFHALDKTLRDIKGNNYRFGGIPIVFGGDFRHCLPVVSKGTRGQIVNSSLKMADFWPEVCVLHLTRNLRVDQDVESQAYSQWLLQIGSGGLTENEMFALPFPVVPVHTGEELIANVYANINMEYQNPTYFISRCILASRNDEVEEINNHVLNLIPNDPIVVAAANAVEDPEAMATYPPEVLQTLTPHGMPSHFLRLKIGAPVMLLRNLNPSQGLCNGVRLRIEQIHQNLIVGTILTGSHFGQTALIPRIKLINQEPNGIPFSRVQFPIRLALAMTVNKSQGQTFDILGLAFTNSPPFSHGQAYVAFSRARNPRNIFALVPFDVPSQQYLCKNVVFTEALLH